VGIWDPAQREPSKVCTYYIKHLRFGNSYFEHSILFRISDFVLRILSKKSEFSTLHCAVGIAWKQYRTNRNNLRLNLYDRMYAVFDGLMTLLSDAQRGEVNDEQLYEFYRRTKQSQFFFGKEISEYLEQIGKNARDLQYLGNMIKDQRLSQKEHEKAVDDRRKVSDWLGAQFEVSRSKFARYLTFRIKA